MHINSLNSIYRLPVLLVLAVSVSIFVSCRGSQSKYDKIIKEAELISLENPDSALFLLDIIDPNELTVDSIKAKYYLLTASIHDKQGHVMLSDSLIRHTSNYFKNKDLSREIKSATLVALYDYWVGNDRYAIEQLDSLSNLVNVPDSLLIYPLRKRAYLGTKILDGTKNRWNIKRLIAIDRDSTWKPQYKYWLYIDYLFNEQNDSALIILNELIDKAISEKLSAEQFRYEYEKIGTLEELDHYPESLELADKFLEKAPGNSIEHYIHLWKSLTLFNMGNRNLAIKELEKADSCASVISEAERDYYDSFAYVLHTVFDYQKTGKLKMIPMALINNRQKDNLFRTQSLQQESEQNALKIENKRLNLKVKSERQRSVIVIIVLAGLLVSGLSIWFALHRRSKTIEAEERAEALQKMVKELKTPSSSSIGQDFLRRAMLQQLGIIKMVAETPTEQNREMLRKISLIGGDTKDTLVSWRNVFEIIDTLYSGFYTRLHNSYGNVLTDKEEQIIVLMLAGFSTKEISVITSQTAATIYVRKSSVRKKLGVPEKEDIMAFLRQNMSA